MAHLRRQIDEATRLEKQLEKEVKDLKAAAPDKPGRESQEAAPFVGENGSSFAAGNKPPEVIHSESSSSALKGLTVPALPVNPHGEVPGTSINPQVPLRSPLAHPQVALAAGISSIENEVLLTKKELAKTRCRVVARRRRAEKLAASLPAEGSRDYEHHSVVLREKQQAVREAVEKAAQLIRKLEKLEAQLLELRGPAPRTRVSGQRRLRYGARARVRQRGEREREDAGQYVASFSCVRRTGFADLGSLAR